MTPSRSFSAKSLALLSICSSAFASAANETTSCRPKHPTWNGQLHPPDEHSPSCGSLFTPYYVPAGATSIDDNHHSITYSPPDAWKPAKDASSVGGSSHVSDVPGANATIKFT
ncbi:hypothetical protein FS749_014141, partial [Ceratobasidium sp. UAMH 11750]